jgi:hypothetical protein
MVLILESEAGSGMLFLVPMHFLEMKISYIATRIILRGVVYELSSIGKEGVYQTRNKGIEN